MTFDFVLRNCEVVVNHPHSRTHQSRLRVRVCLRLRERARQKNIMKTAISFILVFD